VRDAIHPQLNWSVVAPESGGMMADVVMEEAMPAPESRRMMKQSMEGGASSAMPTIRKDYRGPKVVAVDKAEAVDFRQENEIRSTVGIPRWQGRIYALQWDTSALQRAEPFDMVLMTPAMNLVFGFVSSLMLVLLFVATLGVNLRDVMSRLRGGRVSKQLGVSLLVLMPVLAWMPSAVQAEDYPPEYLLQQLAKEVNRPPACLPDCVSLDKLHVSLSADGLLTMRFLINSLDTVAAPLLEVPRGGIEFRAFVASDNGLRSLPLQRSGKTLLVSLTSGVHDVLLYAYASGKRLQLGLPLTVRQYGESVAGWQAAHVGRQGNWRSLSFRRISTQQQPEEGPKGLPRSQIPPFFAVTRELVLSDGLYIDTTVRRLSPMGSVETVVVPAWPQEVILQGSEQVARQGDVIKVVLNAGDSQLRFRSSLQFSEDELANYHGGVLRKIELPPAPPAQRTQWRFDYSSQWNVEVEGLPIIYEQTRSGENIKSLRPWPGESASILVSRVEPIPGATVAIQELTLALAPHAAAHGGPGGTLEIHAEIETTQAQTLLLEIPEATLNSVTINGRRVNNEASGTVRIPLDIGKAQVTIAGELIEGISGIYREPTVTFKSRDGETVAIYNALTEISMPQNRWVYRADGKGVGPDFLFWSILPPLVLLALALHFMKLGQINGLSWLLVMVGFTQANSFGLYIGIGMSMLFIGWLYLLKVREGLAPFEMSAFRFNALQIFLVVVTLAALLSMADGLFNGLLGHPKMQVAGNQSDAWFLRWFNDHGMPQASVLSLPLLYYRIVILLWAVWLSFIVLRWIKYGWHAFSSETLYRASTKQAAADSDAPGEQATNKSGSVINWLYVAVIAFLIFLAVKWFL
jgi:hypothetical protein